MVKQPFKFANRSIHLRRVLALTLGMPQLQRGFPSRRLLIVEEAEDNRRLIHDDCTAMQPS